MTEPKEPFGRAELDARVDAVRARMGDSGFDVLLLTSPENVYYLTGLNHQGYFAFTALVLPMRGRPVVLARRMETPTLVAQVPHCEHVGYGDHEEPGEVLASLLHDRYGGSAPGAIGVEMRTMWFPLDTWERIRTSMPADRMRDASGLVDACRDVKSEAEIACVRHAAQISSRAVEAGLTAVAPGVAQRDVAAALYGELIESGSEYPGFVPLVRTRDTLLHEHVTWRDRPIETGDAVFIEMSASVGRYHAPLTRMAYVGEPPPGTARAAEIAAAGLEGVRDALRPGTPAGKVYEAWQTVIDEGLGHDRYRRHHCGYLVGIGFPPSWVGGARVLGIRPDSDWPVREGMTFHVLSWLLGQEPADYVLSDTVLVTADGGELLTTTARTPFAVS